MRLIMIKKSTISLLVTGCLLASATALASSGFEKLLAPQAKPADQETKTTNSHFTDFSGNWIGTCSDGATPTLQITNTHDLITIDGENKVIGKLETSSETTSKYTHLTQTLLHWNADGSQLILNLAVEDQSFSDEVRDNDFFVGKSTFTLTNGQLVVDSTYQSLVNKLNIVCTYKK